MLKLQMWIHDKLVRPVQNVEGATMIEYGLIVALVSVVTIGVLTAVGGSLTDLYQAVDDALQTAL
ncbi:MAG TPA: Flp family type IVb pilin [Alphaproteobacteria bacterium]|nr:Flp family type IVb pilin [Alphaproteobacteria bacterium]